MEKINVTELLNQLQEAEKADKLTAEERVAELEEIKETVKQISVLLKQLFDRREELEQAEEAYQLEQELLEQQYIDLNDLYSRKK